MLAGDEIVLEVFWTSWIGSYSYAHNERYPNDRHETTTLFVLRGNRSQQLYSFINQQRIPLTYNSGTDHALDYSIRERPLIREGLF
jgi:hypothetical protein